MVSSFKLELQMNEMRENVSIWAKLYKTWEKLESDFRFARTPAKDELGTGIRAMEIELRALRAKPGPRSQAG